jgi:hypothetical protein
MATILAADRLLCIEPRWRDGAWPPSETLSELHDRTPYAHEDGPGDWIFWFLLPFSAARSSSWAKGVPGTTVRGRVERKRGPRPGPRVPSFLGRPAAPLVRLGSRGLAPELSAGSADPEEDQGKGLPVLGPAWSFRWGFRHRTSGLCGQDRAENRRFQSPQPTFSWPGRGAWIREATGGSANRVVAPFQPETSRRLEPRLHIPNVMNLTHRTVSWPCGWPRTRARS